MKNVAGLQQEVAISQVHNNTTGYACCCAACGGGIESDPFDAGGAVGASGSKPVWDLSQITSNLTRSNAEWAGGTISYSFFNSKPAGYSGEGDGFSAFSAAQRTAAREAMQLWDDVAGVSFTETNDASGDIRFANTTTGPGVAWAYYPGGGRGGDVWVNPNYYHNSQLNPDDYGFLTMIHEVGHALGLSHPGAYNAGSGQMITYANSAEYAQDTREFTAMSYFNASYSGADHVNGGTSFAASPLLHDIAAIQSIYGVDTTTRTGDTVYGFNSTAGRDAFDFTINSNPVVAIWDAGGTDTLDFSGYTSYYATAKIDLNEGAFSDTPGMTRNIAVAYGAKIENAEGGAWHDQIIGNALDNVLDGGSGGDTIWGNDGSDSLIGGAGNDTLDGGAGDDFFFGGTGDDSFGGGLGLDRVVYSSDSSDFSITKDQYGIITVVDLNLGDGNDGTDRVDTGVEWLNFIDLQILTSSITAAPAADMIVTGSSASDSLEGSAGNDTLSGLSGNDRLFGLIGDDTLIGGSGHDTLLGGDGNDVAVFEGLREGYWITFDGGGTATVQYQGKKSAYWGTDTVAADVESFTFSDGTWATGSLPANVAPDLYIKAKSKGGKLSGGNGDDTLIGRGGNDKLCGGEGNDILNAKSGHNIAYGGAGDDRLYSKSGNDKLYGQDGNDYISAGGGNDKAYGGAGNDTIFGGRGADKLYGHDGNDYVNGGSGNNKAYGGAGDDRLYSKSGADKLYGQDGDDYINAGSGNDKAYGGAGNDTIFGGNGVDRLVGGDGDDYINGGKHNNKLYGGAGDDRLYSKSGADKLYGQDGDDYINAGSGNDKAYGGAGNDTIFGGNGVDRLVGGDGDDYINGGKHNNKLYGGAGNDTLIGGRHVDKIYGHDGNDLLTGGGGKDTLYGGAGDDTYFTDGRDKIREGLGQGEDTVVVGRSFGLGSNFENLTLSGSANIRGYGNAEDNVLTGNNGNNVLSGASGSDTLIGGLGDDILVGGTGADIFFFSLLTDAGGDRVVDFNRSEDILHFSDVLDGVGNDFADIDMQILSIVNEGAGGNVEVNFVNGADIIFDGLGSGAAGNFSSIADLVDDEVNQVFVV
ncbi:M10 family metallopeptidase C-terminal domain-containing protein [Pelagibius sp. Alg239-R121]|uniref:M10 family metallopeptidase C-terminal domain-containing protein n=1 Tax=Pelagibius sp. Alg239-R121 TaxID=2993448 RepID=UPI0024A7285A|nr:M10 family metallopeptidase C-terminal domain-containing protein [Pelagibius sp. Alg239-R121]